MRARLTRVFSALLVAGLAMLGGLCQSAAAADYIVNFGEVRGKPGVLTPTGSLKLCLKDTGYVFGVQVTPPSDTPYKLKIVLHMPATPKSIGGDLRSNNFGREAVDEQGSKKGVVSVTYAFDEGDPLGKWSVDVVVNDALVSTIDFTVAAPASCP